MTEICYLIESPAPRSKAIAFFLPRLDMFTQSGWLLSNRQANIDMAWLIAQSAIYVALLSVAALFDLKRKNF